MEPGTLQVGRRRDRLGSADLIARSGATFESDIDAADIHHCINTAFLLGGVDMERWLTFRKQDPDGFSQFMALGRQKLKFFEKPFVSWRNDVALFMGPRLSGYSAVDVEDLQPLLPVVAGRVDRPAVRGARPLQCLGAGAHAGDEAQRLGLINEVVAADLLLPTADTWAGYLAQGGPKSLATTKEILRKCSRQSLSVDELAKASAAPRLGDECRDGLTAFFEKRPAPWSAEA